MGGYFDCHMRIGKYGK